MTTWRFSRLLLLLVLVMLAGVSLTLLTTAYLGAEKALQQEIELAHERDQRMLDSIVDSHFRNIRQYSEEISQSLPVQRALSRGDGARLDDAMQGVMRDSYSQYIDAMVIEHDGRFHVAPNVSLLNLELPLEALSGSRSRLGDWVTVDTEVRGKRYSLLRLTLPVVEPGLGEVVGRLHTFVLLNDNFWILNELQSLFGARAIALSHEGSVLDSLQSGAHPWEGLEALKASEAPVRVGPQGVLRSHVLKVGDSAPYRVYTALPSDSHFALRDTYIANLGFATLMVAMVAALLMLVINRITASALGNLTRYAEQAPDGGMPRPFQGSQFEEFTRVGRAFEQVLHRIHERDKYLAGIIDHSPDLIFLKDLDHSYRLVNRRYAEVLNTTAEQLDGRPMWDVLDQDVMEKALAMDREVLRTGKPVRYKLALDTLSGKRRFLFSKFPIIDDDGVPYLIGGIATDVTDMEQAEEELELAREVLAATPDAAIVLDEQQRVLIANRAFVEMSGFPHEQASSAMRLFLMAHPGLLESLTREEHWEQACEFERRDGGLERVAVTVHALRRDGRQRHVILFREIDQPTRPAPGREGGEGRERGE
ncbi:PAS domain-containing protein [Halomonas sp. YLGW01]|uniref:PAS domain-containing protein n=1 Tax=Halomonas sp. YLGW01 TaxID=2773308 RepID=UPI00177D3739|nr:PAS domain-containing protein [Halomonas sp. YLGW01]